MEIERGLISILLPIYKPILKELKVAIDSMLNQTYTRFELLVLFEKSGDAADENTDRYLAGINDIRLRVIEVPRGSGLTTSLNIGIKESRGQYLARMDGDDYSLPKRLEKQFNFMETNPNVDLYGSAARIMNTRRIVFKKNGMSSETRAARMMFDNAGLAHPTAFYRRLFIDKSGLRYCDVYTGYEDYRFWTDAVGLGGRIDSTDEVLLYYRVKKGQFTKHAESAIGWDRTTKKRMIEYIGEFSEYEKEAIADWNEINSNVSYKVYHDLCRKIITENNKSKVVTDRALRREIAFQLFVRDLRILAKKHDAKVLKGYFKEFYKPSYTGYIMRNLYHLARRLQSYRIEVRIDQRSN